MLLVVAVIVIVVVVVGRSVMTIAVVVYSDLEATGSD